jgi:hypothetical protein
MNVGPAADRPRPRTTASPPLRASVIQALEKSLETGDPFEITAINSKQEATSTAQRVYNWAYKHRVKAVINQVQDGDGSWVVLFEIQRTRTDSRVDKL